MNKGKIKIMHIIPTFNLIENKGVLEFLYLLIKYLDKEHVEIIILAFYSKAGEAAEYEKIGARISICSEHHSDNSYLSLIQWTSNEIEREHPDIVHTHLFWPDTIGRESALRMRVPLVVSTEHNTNYDETEKQRQLKRRLSTQTDAIICITDAVRQYSIEKDQIAPEKLYTIHNGFNAEKYGKPLEPITELSNELYFIGRFVPQKQPLELIRICSELFEDLPFLSLNCVGDGPLLESCKNLTLSLKIQDRVRFHGFQINPFENIKNGSLFVLNSAFEGQGIAIMEAMAQGMPCILPKCGGIPEVIEDGVTGFMFEGSNPDQLKQKLIQVLEMDMGGINRIRKNAWKVVNTKFHPAKMAENYVKLYERKLAEKVF